MTTHLVWVTPLAGPWRGQRVPINVDAVLRAKNKAAFYQEALGTLLFRVVDTPETDE